MIWWQVALVLVGAYLLGSFPSAYLAGKISKGIDIRTVGSKNMGTMNTTYTLGPVCYVILPKALFLYWQHAGSA